MFALIFGGEMMFSLPCHLPRYYRPTVLEVFGLSDADLGEACVLLRRHGRGRLFPRRHRSRSALGAEADDQLAGSNRCGRQVLDGLFRLR